MMDAQLYAFLHMLDQKPLLVMMLGIFGPFLLVTVTAALEYVLDAMKLINKEALKQSYIYSIYYATFSLTTVGSLVVLLLVGVIVFDEGVEGAGMKLLLIWLSILAASFSFSVSNYALLPKKE